MAVSNFKQELQSMALELYRFPPQERYSEFERRIDALPPSKNKDLTTSLIPLVKGLLECGVDSSTHQPRVINVYNHAPGSSLEIMEDKTANQMNNTGTFNGPVGFNQTFTNCFNIAKEVEAPATKQALETLITEVERIHPQLSEGERTKAERKLKTLTEEVSLKEPDKDQIALSGKGLIDAAKTCAQMAGPVVVAVKAIAGLMGVSLP